MRFVANLWGYGVQFTFRAVKLVDYRANLTSLQNIPNPFATIILAHLQAQETRQDPNARLAWKLAILRQLYTQGYNREQIIGLFRFIDWVMALPADLTRQFWHEVERFEREQKMPYITSIEQIGREAGLKEGLQEGLKEGLKEGLQEGLRQGLLDGIELALKIKFGAASAEVLPEIRGLTNLEVIRAVYTQLETAQTIDDVRGIYR